MSLFQNLFGRLFGQSDTIEFPDTITDPSYAFLPENIYHDSAMDPTADHSGFIHHTDPFESSHCHFDHSDPFDHCGTSGFDSFGSSSFGSDFGSGCGSGFGHDF